VSRRPSPQTAAVVAALAADTARWRHGYDLMQELSIKAGSLYPILIRLGERGLLDSAWEASPAPGRPARHLYRLTAAGVRFAATTAAATAADHATAPTHAAADPAGARPADTRPAAPRHRPAPGGAW
jgi:PadR family transcriptional regulator PadR